jgi:very-short-patch-repair endonuclease
MANERARRLRRSMTPQEVKLWVRLREMRTRGIHFRRQVPRDEYILDFACLRRRVIVEVDGGQHGHGRQGVHDVKRDEYFRRRGFEVLRFWNHEIDSNLDGVIETIYRVSQSRAPTPASLRSADPPPTGEG